MRKAGAPSAPCCLFWPPPGVRVDDGSESHSTLWTRLKRSAIAQSLHLAVGVRGCCFWPSQLLLQFCSIGAFAAAGRLACGSHKTVLVSWIWSETQGNTEDMLDHCRTSSRRCMEASDSCCRQLTGQRLKKCVIQKVANHSLARRPGWA